MEHILNILPIVYVYWASTLMVWSGVVCAIMVKNLLSYKATKCFIRRSDTVTLISVSITGIVLHASIFIIPQVTVLFIEIAMILALWYTVFLCTINHISILTLLYHHNCSKIKTLSPASTKTLP